jgi:2-polyprenyl-3-methyl-5-hydroxy-6-metoxy-1,4-benzoquinol methylase
MSPSRPRCPSCGAPDAVLLKTGLRDRYAPQQEYRIARCRICRFAFTDPVRESYSEEYEPYCVKRQRERAEGTRAAILRAFYRGKGTVAERFLLFVPYVIFRLRDWMKMRARDVSTFPFRRRGRLLDVGCGTGELLAVWSVQQESCVGVEPKQTVALAARERTGLDIRPGTLFDHQFPPESFDVVTISHVLEHVPDARALLSRAADLLRPGGELLVWVPNFESLLRPWMGAGWFPYEIPRHLWHFRASEVGALARAVGLRVVEVTPEANEWVYRQSVKALGGPWPALLGRRLVRILAMILCRLLRRADAIRLRARKDTGRAR